MKLLVTGATGLVGAELVRQLLDAGAADVRILRRPSSDLGLLGRNAERVEHAVGDVTDPESVRAAMRGVTHVYHVAAYVGFGGGGRARRRLYEVNVGGTAHVVDAALAEGVSRLVHTSSMAAFGRPERAEATQANPIDESAEWRASAANTDYAHSKHLAELEVQRGVAEGLDAVLVNPALIFGVGRPGENTREIAEKVRDRRLPAAPSGGTNVVDVRDVAAGHRRAMAAGETGGRYFLGAENLAWRTILDTLADAFGVPPPRFTLPPSAALAFAAAAEGVAAVTRSRPLVNRETARLASRFYRYSNRRAVEALGCTFRPFAETAAYVAEGVGRDAGRR